MHVDGVGTKILVAQMMNYFEPIGYDCVAMGVNDIICIGAKPVAFLDYLAVEKVNKKLITQIAKGISKAAEESGVYVLGNFFTADPFISLNVPLFCFFNQPFR